MSYIYVHVFELRNIYLHFTIWATHEGGVLHSTWVPFEPCFHWNGIVAKQILVLDCITSTSFKRETVMVIQFIFGLPYQVMTYSEFSLIAWLTAVVIW
jgi:hypothetical protein